ncbi:hypothetical protein F5879DRAFT_991875 [Lentinula edodes]|nr:hypothetical protein F5879DRAFT_991875 [Lentinula edodes]
MDSQDKYLRRSSSSSAIDLTRTPAGIASSAPPSPSLEPSNNNSRRRTSWGKVDLGQDPLQLDTQPGATNSAHYTVHDDPFQDSPTDDRSFAPIPFATTTQYDAQPEEDYTLSYYTTAHAGPSTTSLA